MIMNLLGNLYASWAERGDRAGTGALTIMHAKMIRALGAAVGMALLLTMAIDASGVAHAAAQTETPKKTAPPNKAEQSLNRGIDAYKKNSLARAVGALSSALSSGGLDTTGTARALYYRGLAYRRQGQTALAITDLTNALWLNNGLSEKERADALENRAAAYQAAGIADPGAPQADPAPASAVAANSKATVASEAVASPAKPAAAPAASPQPSSPVTTAAIAPADDSPAASGNGNPLSGIGSFFGNLFSGGSSSSGSSQQAAAPAQPSSEFTTASTGAPAATSSWNSATQVGSTARTPAESPQPKRERTAALAEAPVKTDTPPLGQSAAPLKGKYKLQLAAVRSRAQAEELAKRFAAKHSAKTGGRTPVIEEAVFGNMGTFYRVNIGPYASAAEPDKLCSSVRASGFDCLVVTH